MNTSAFYDVLVIGGGASGLAAAITVARAGKASASLSAMSPAALSSFATGNGRCNLSNESIDPQRYNHPRIRRIRYGPQPEQELMGFFSLAGYHDNLRGRPAVPALPSRRIGARRASQRLRPPRYHLNLWVNVASAHQSF